MRRDVKLNENVSASELDSTYVPSLACEPSLAIVPSYSSLLDNSPSNISSDTDSDDENPPLPILPPSVAPLTTSQLP